MWLRPHSILFVLAALAVSAQTPGPLPSFEVASIKPSPPTDRPMSRLSGGPAMGSRGQLSYSNCPLEMLIRRAFNALFQWEIVLPASLPSDRYDIIAKIPSGATQEQVYLMLQNLLAERFGLVFHKEAREMPAYELAVGKDGPKLTPAKAPAGNPDAPLPVTQASLAALPKDKGGWPILPADAVGVFGFTVPPTTRTMYRGQPLSAMIERLSGVLQRPVIDKTGLTGMYDFDVITTRPELSSGTASAEEARQAREDMTSQMASGLLAAIERLGLRAVSTKAQIEVVVVDHVNSKPTEN